MKHRKKVQILSEEKKLCAEVVPGLEEIFILELKKEFGGKVQVQTPVPGFVYFKIRFDLLKLYNLKTASSIYLSIKINGKISLDENMHVISKNINYIISQNNKLWGENVFETFKVAAKNAAHPDFIKFKKYISIKSGLNLAFKGGDLVIKCFDELDGIFIRITPRPLSVRFWRVANFKAALNASIASAMIFLTYPSNMDKVLNICAGSGTLLIERCLFSPPPLLAFGFEKDDSTLQYAKENLKASHISKKYKIFSGDCTILDQELTRVEVPNQKFNVVLGDLPFGLSVGNKKTNISLYKKMLRQVSQNLEPDSRLCLLTQDIGSLNIVLNELKDHFEIKKTLQIKMSTNRDGVYIFPMIYVLTNKVIQVKI